MKQYSSEKKAPLSAGLSFYSSTNREAATPSSSPSPGCAGIHLSSSGCTHPQEERTHRRGWDLCHGLQTAQGGYRPLTSNPSRDHADLKLP